MIKIEVKELYHKVVEFRQNRKTRQKNLTLSDRIVSDAKEDILFYSEMLGESISFSEYVEILLHIMHRNTNLERGADIL